MPGANRHGSELRKAINRHMWRHHGQIIGKGGDFDRLAQHDELHAQGNEEGYAGDPLHRHEPGTLEQMCENLIRENQRLKGNEGEGTE